VTGPATSLHHNIVALHRFLESKRSFARQMPNQEGLGPRVMIVGSVPCSGKSTLCRTLANYCTRAGYQPSYVDLNCHLPQFGYPECVSVASLQVPIDVEEEGAFAPSLLFHFGETAPNRNVPLWRHCMKQLSSALLQRSARCDRSRVGGVFIDFPTFDEENLELYDEAVLKGGKVDVHPLDALIATMELLEVDVLIVLGSDYFRWRLSECVQKRSSGHDISLNGTIAAKVYAAQLAADEAGTTVAVNASNITKIGNISAPTLPMALTLENGGVVQIVAFPPVAAAAPPPLFVHKVLELAAKQRWLQYFFGTVTSPVKPTMVELNLAHCKLVRIGGAAAQSMAGLLPLDEDPGIIDPAVVTYVLPGDMNLNGRILALSCAVYVKPRDGDHSDRDPTGEMLFDAVPTKVCEARLKEMRVIGFGLVRHATHSTLTVLIPEPTLPQGKGHCFIVTNTTLLTT
jgi:polyribonucleotide 5'-hydroxyl-kinase